MKYLLSSLILYFVAIASGLAQPAEPSIVLTSGVNIGEKLSFNIGLGDTNVYWIDWGDGKLIKYVITTDRYGIHGNYQSVPKLGDTVKIYSNEIYSFSCPFNQIELLDISKCYELEHLDCSHNSISNLSIYYNSLLNLLDCSHNFLTQLNIVSHMQLTTLYCSDNNISEITWENYSGGLIVFDCSNNQLRDLKYINFEKIYDFDFHNNLISSIDVSYCTNLKNLNCSNNKLKELYLDNNLKLENLDFSNNMISEIDVSRAESLYTIKCSYNNLKTLDLHRNCYLIDIRCSHNQIAILNMPKYYFEKITYPSVSISYIDCSYNNIDSTLSIPEHVLLGYPDFEGIRAWSINCSNNFIKSVLLGNGTEIVTLDCSNNLIEKLDLSKTTYYSPIHSLQYLNCSNNGMKQLLLADNYPNAIPASIYCNNNKLTNLSIPEINLRVLSIMNNQIDKEKLDWIYTKLQDLKETTDTMKYDKHLWIANNPGTSESSINTALLKGWILDSNYHNIKITNNLENGGFEIGSGYYSDSSTITIRAIPLKGYVFLNWTENGKIISTRDIFTFSSLKDREFIANYHYKEIKQFVVNVTTNPITYGVAYGSGMYFENEDVRIYSDPLGYYEFVNWTEDGKVISTSENYAFSISKDRNLVANFKKVHCNVIVYGSEEQMTLEGNGVYERGSTVTIKAKAKHGFKFVRWSRKQGGDVYSSTYQFVIERDEEFWAKCEEDYSNGVEYSDTTSFSIFPNPCTDYITINEIAEDESIEIVSMAGEVVLKSIGSRKIDIKNLIAGVYYVLYKNKALKLIKV